MSGEEIAQGSSLDIGKSIRMFVDTKQVRPNTINSETGAWDKCNVIYCGAHSVLCLFSQIKQACLYDKI